MEKNVIQRLAAVRIKEAKILYENDEYSGAYYLAGYSVELALKAVIAKSFKKNVLPDKKFVNDIYVHKLEDLIKHAGLNGDLSQQQAEPTFNANWQVVRNWSENKRYEIITQIDAQDLIEAITTKRGGILKWLRSKW